MGDLAPAQDESGHLTMRECGTPQGGVISRLLSNLFLHYAFDQWMLRKWRHLPSKARRGIRELRESFFAPCYPRDERRPLELALQDVGSNHRKLLRHNGRGGDPCHSRQLLDAQAQRGLAVQVPGPSSVRLDSHSHFTPTSARWLVSRNSFRTPLLPAGFTVLGSPSIPLVPAVHNHDAGVGARPLCKEDPAAVGRDRDAVVGGLRRLPERLQPARSQVKSKKSHRRGKRRSLQIVETASGNSPRMPYTRLHRRHGDVGVYTIEFQPPDFSALPIANIEKRFAIRCLDGIEAAVGCNLGFDACVESVPPNLPLTRSIGTKVD